LTRGRFPRSNAAVPSNPRLLVAFSGLRFTLFPIPIITLFWTDHVGMSLADVMVLQAIFSLGIVVLEFPSGYAADRLGHRRTLLAAGSLWLLGWLAYTRATTFAEVVGAELLIAAGLAFSSGATEALLFESLEAGGHADAYARWDGRARAAAQASEALSSACGGWAYASSPRLPFWLQLPVAAAAIAVAARTHEARTPHAGAGHLARAARVVRDTLRHPRLPSTMALSTTLGLSSFLMVWLIQPYMQHRGVPEEWFGLVWAGFHVWLAAVSLSSGRIQTAIGRGATLVACCVMVPLGYGLLALGSSPAATCFYLLLMTVRGLQGPILGGVLQADAPAEDRASVLSLNALLFRLGVVVAGPPAGLLVDRLGLDLGLCVIGSALAFANTAAFTCFRRARA